MTIDIDQHSERHHQVLDAMERFGGGFVQALAACWRKADPQNHAKLVIAFGDTYYAQYLAQVERGEGD